MTLQIHGIDRPNIAALSAPPDVTAEARAPGVPGRAIAYGQKLRHRDRSRPAGGAVEGPILWLGDKMRSLDYAARWAASLGMTESYAIALACRGTIAVTLPP